MRTNVVDERKRKSLLIERARALLDAEELQQILDSIEAHTAALDGLADEQKAPASVVAYLDARNAFLLPPAVSMAAADLNLADAAVIESLDRDGYAIAPTDVVGDPLNFIERIGVLLFEPGLRCAAHGQQPPHGFALGNSDWHHDVRGFASGIDGRTREDLLGHPPNTVFAFVAVDEFTIENGATQLIPGSHRFTHDHARQIIAATPSEFIHAIMPVGAALLFFAETIHRSAPRERPYRRRPRRRSLQFVLSGVRR